MADNDQAIRAEEPRHPRWHHQVANGIAIAMGVIALATVGVGWAVVVTLFGNSTATTADIAMMSAFALLATAGFMLYVVAYRRRALGFAALGLFFVAFSPTAFAYLGNAIALIGALCMWAVAAHKRLNSSGKKSSVNDDSQARASINS